MKLWLMGSDFVRLHGGSGYQFRRTEHRLRSTASSHVLALLLVRRARLLLVCHFKEF